MAISSIGSGDASYTIPEDVPAVSPQPDVVPAVDSPTPVLVETSGFDDVAATPPLVVLDPLDRSVIEDLASEGRTKGTNDDSIGRKSGTNDDSIGRTRGTNDDSIGNGQGAAGVGRDLSELAPVYGTDDVDLNRATEGLSGKALEQLTALLADEATAVDTQTAITSASFAGLTADQREKFVNVMAKSDADGVRMMALACQQAGQVDWEPATDGTTVLDHLDRMANTEGMGPFIGGLIADVIVPDRIWQGNAPTCTASSMQYELAKHHPSEYMRLIVDLAITGKATMAGGGVLETSAGHALQGSINANDLRSPSEAVFQAALMEFANGAATYDLEKLQSSDGEKTYLGLFGSQIQTALGQLFKKEYETTRFTNNAEAERGLRMLNVSKQPNAPVLVNLVVDETHNHCVAFEGLSNGVVSLRDPQTGRPFTISSREFIETAASVLTIAGAVIDPPPFIRKGRLFPSSYEP